MQTFHAFYHFYARGIDHPSQPRVYKVKRHGENGDLNYPDAFQESQHHPESDEDVREQDHLQANKNRQFDECAYEVRNAGLQLVSSRLGDRSTDARE